MLQVITRDAAHLAGKPRFFTGVPCKHGHLSERYVLQGACIECLKKYKKFAPNAYTSELVPWNPEMYYVPRTMTPDQYAALQDYLGVCVESWVAAMGLATGDIPMAYKLRREWFEDRKAALVRQAAVPE